MNIALLINVELANISRWLTTNKLHLNIGKTKYMIISLKDKPPDLNLVIGNSYIVRKQVQKFLGVYIDDKMCFTEHTKKISTKLSQGIGVLRKIKKTCSTWSFETIILCFYLLKIYLCYYFLWVCVPKSDPKSKKLNQ